MYLEKEFDEFMTQMMTQASKKYDSGRDLELDKKYFDGQDDFLKNCLMDDELRIVHEWAGELLTLEGERQRFLYEQGMKDAVRLLKLLQVIV